MTALWTLIAVAICASIALLANSDAGPGFALVALLGWVVFLPLTWPVKGVRRLSDLAFLAGFVFFLTFGLRSVLLLMRAQPELPGSAPDLTILAALAGFLPIHFDALLLAIVCWVVFTIGYRLPVGSALAAKIGDPGLERLGSDRLAFFICLLAGGGWAARIAFRSTYSTFEHLDPNALGAGDTLLTWVSAFAPAALALALLGVVRFRRHPAFIGLAAGLVLLEVGFALYTGIRTPLFSVGLALVAFGVVRAARPGRWLLIVLPIVLIVFGATVVYRIPQVFSQSRADDPITRFATTLDRSFELGPVGLAEVGLWNVSARYIGVDSVAQVLLAGPPKPDWGERHLLSVPSALIPRFLWADKPRADYVFDFAHTYHGVPGTVVVPYAPTWVGDLLLSFPLLIVPPLMLILGLACRVLNDYGWRAQRRRSFGLVPYALLLPIATQADAWISVGIYQLVQIVAIVVALALVLGLGRLVQRSSEPATSDLPRGRALTRAVAERSPGAAP